MLKDTLMRMRKKHGYSQQEIADILEVSRQTISNWELGQGAPALDKAKLLSELYQVSLDDLAGNVEFVTKKSVSPLLSKLIGKQCKLDCKGMDGASIAKCVRILDVNEEWIKIEYERKKETVVNYIELSMINGFEIMEERL